MFPGSSDTAVCGVTGLRGVVPRLVRSGSLYGRWLRGTWGLRTWRKAQIPTPRTAKKARAPMTMPAMAPGERDAGWEEGGEEVAVAVEVSKEETLEPWGMGSPGLRARVAAAAASFWRESWVASRWWG